MLPNQQQQLYPPPRVQSQPPYTIVYQTLQRPSTVFASTANSPLQSQSISSSCASSPQLSMTSSSGGGGNNVDATQQQGTAAPTNLHDQNRLLLKCAHFFKSLSRFKPNRSQEQHQKMLQLLREGVTSEMSAEEFIAKLCVVTGSQDKGTLLPFLKMSLPSLRVSIRKGEQAELQKMLRLGSAGGDSPEETALPSPQQQQSDNGVDEAITVQRQEQISRSVPPQSLQQNQTGQIVNIVRPLSVQNSLNAPFPANTSTTIVVHRKPPTPQQQQLQRQAPVAVASPAQQIQAVQQQQQPQISRSSSTSLSVAATNVQESSASTTTITQQAQLAPESLQNLPPMLLNPQALADRILAHMPDAQGVDSEVLSIISMAAEARLRTVLAHLAALADHRQRPLRIDPHYAMVDEPRKQIRFMEDIERKAHESRETAEKEAMMRTAKSKGGKDREVVEKAKLMQKADREAMVNHEANLAAFAALGVTKTGGAVKRPFGAPNGPGAGVDWKSGMQNQGTTGGLIKDRPPVVRLKRVTMRDLQYFLCNDPLVPSSSRLRYRIALSSLNVDENNTTNT